MSSYYDDWLLAGERAQEAFRCSPMIAKDRELPWERTRQDARSKLMIAKRLGFPTMGSNVIKAEIPVGWHTGKHVHGEESIHILKGRGFSIINGQRFDTTDTTYQQTNFIGLAVYHAQDGTDASAVFNNFTYAPLK